MSTSISSLPAELLREITLHLPDRLSDSTSLCLVSRAWNAIATNRLYKRDVFLVFLFEHHRIMDESWSKPCRLARTLRARPDLAALLTGITVSTDSRKGNKALDLEMPTAFEALRTILEAGINIVSLTFDATDMRDHTATRLKRFVRTITSCSNLLLRLQKVSASYTTRGELVEFFPNALPSLTRLEIDYLDLGCRRNHPPPSWSLRLLIIRRGVGPGNFKLLEASPTCTSLESIHLPMTDANSWKQFANITTVGVGLGSERWVPPMATLRTFSAATTVILLFDSTSGSAHRLLRINHSRILHELPRSVTTLDLSGFNQAVDDYILDWLRFEQPSQCPKLNKIKMRDQEDPMDDNLDWDRVYEDEDEWKGVRTGWRKFVDQVGSKCHGIGSRGEKALRE